MHSLTLGVMGGCGHIGLIHAAGLASLGYRVVSYDLDQSRVDSLEQGVVPFHEPGLEELVRQGLDGGRLTFTNCLAPLREAEVVYVCVGTPSLPGGPADTAQVQKAVEKLARVAREPATAVIKSTVPVGTARKLSAMLSEAGFPGKITLISSPEFLAEGSGVEDFFRPSRIVIGGESREAMEKVAMVHAPPGIPVIITGWENAELIKHASNALLAAKISFINEIALLGEAVGSDIRVVSRGVGLDPRIGPHFLEAGVGFSGPCLEKDLCSLIKQFTGAGAEAPLLRAALHVNRQRRWGLIRKLEKLLETIDGKKIGILGLAFKPGTDDIRGSHSIPIMEEILSLGGMITAHDPMVVTSPAKIKQLQERFPEVRWTKSPYAAAEGKDALLILTAWPEYRKLDLKKLKRCLSNPVIVDGRNLFDRVRMDTLKIKYTGMGI